jgi:hypothetical protein
MMTQIDTRNVISRGVRNRVAEKLNQTPGVFEMPSTVQLTIESQHDDSLRAVFRFAYLDGKEKVGGVFSQSRFNISFGQSSNRILSLSVTLPRDAFPNSAEPAAIKKIFVDEARGALQNAVPDLHFMNASRNADLIAQILDSLRIGNES